MIQRLQSLYLLFVPVALVVMLIFPLASFKSSGGLFYLYMQGYVMPETVMFMSMPPWYIIPVLGGILAVLAIVVIFLYNNRIRQLFINRIALIVNILFIAAIFYITDRTANLEEGMKSAYHIGAYLPLIPAILIYLANGRIRKDEMKVRAADRLR